MRYWIIVLEKAKTSIKFNFWNITLLDCISWLVWKRNHIGISQKGSYFSWTYFSNWCIFFLRLFDFGVCATTSKLFLTLLWGTLQNYHSLLFLSHMVNNFWHVADISQMGSSWSMQASYWWSTCILSFSWGILLSRNRDLISSLIFLWL